MSKLAHLAPGQHRDEYANAMRDAASIIAIRNGVVHGIGWSDEEITRTQRPDRAVKPDVEHDWWIVDYDRGLLIGAGRRAHAIGGFIQARAATWPMFHG